MRRWLLNYTLMSLGTVVLLIGVVWLVGGFEDMGLSRDGLIALIIAVVVTVVFSLGLMGLVFYSGRSGHDETIMDGQEYWENRDPGRHKRKRERPTHWG